MANSWFYHIAKTGEISHLSSLEEALKMGKKEGFIWLEYCHPEKEDLAPLGEALGLHPLSIEDCLDENQIPKIEDYPNHSFILFNGFQYTQKKVSIYEFDVFIGDKFLVTVSQTDPQDRPYQKELEHQVKLDSDNGRKGPAFLAHLLLDQIVDQKFIAVEALEEDLNTTEDEILGGADQFNPARLLTLRRDLLALRKSLFHEREILMKICRNDCRYISDKALLLYRDIYDHLAKFFELTETYRDVVTSLMEMYLTLLNNQMSKAANETNITVRRLTFITTIFMPLTLLAGIGGMSEWSMMTGPENWRIAYPAFLLGMAVLGILSYFLLRWIEKRSR